MLRWTFSRADEFYLQTVFPKKYKNIVHSSWLARRDDEFMEFTRTETGDKTFGHLIHGIK